MTRMGISSSPNPGHAQVVTDDQEKLHGSSASQAGGSIITTVYGPVPSKRLGQSLGVDPIPAKTCNYNCVYCQLGRTTPLTNTRKSFFPPQDILAEVQAALTASPPGSIDFITFVGQGEPLLCASLGWLIRRVRDITDIPVAVITNGSLLSRSEVREEVSPAHVLMPTLDAADQETFRQINRPWPQLRLADIIQGMATFRDQFDGQLWVEVMLVRGLNDDENTLLGIGDALAQIRPDQVHVNVPVRPPAEAWVQPPDEEGLMRAVAILGDIAQVVMPYEGTFKLADDVPVTEAIEQIIRRHPMRESELLTTLAGRVPPAEIQETLRALETSGQARCIEYRGHRFWKYAE